MIDIAWADPAETVVRPEPNGPTSVHSIIHEVAKKHNLTWIEITGAQRHAAFVHARQEIMYRASKETHASLAQIGRTLGNRDHTTVIHGIRRHQERLDKAQPVSASPTTFHANVSV